MCQKPEKVRGMVIRELSGELLQCPQRTTTPTLTSHLPTMPGDSASTLPSSSSPDAPLVTQDLPPSTRRAPSPTLTSYLPVYPTRQGGARTKRPLEPKEGKPAVTAYKVTWARMGPSLTGDTVRERMVGGDHRGIRLPNLEPKSTYRICVIPLDVFNNYRPKDDTKCTEVTTTPASFGPNNKRPVGPEQATQPDPSSPFLLAGLIGGAVIVVLVVLLSIFCWHMHKKDRSKSSADWKYNRGRRKDDYCEAGTKKDNSILEMTETSFQIVSLNNEQLLKGDFRIQPIYTPNGGTGFRDCPLGTNSTVYCKNNVQDADLCHT
ncbi:hypothetical protein CRUP_020487 [Coryphaenoides rupestris]|nr:hypothetical protein CRUP_020487 [Coryphaenoides rupestris]